MANGGLRGKWAMLSAVFCISWLLGDAASSCNFHPSLWCSSEHIARTCLVEEQCRSTVWSKQTAAPKVNLTLYYETLCPDCKNFIHNQLWPTFLRVAEIFNLELIPYGNAGERMVGNKWVFTCQHGPVECLGNLIQTCALDIIGNVTSALPFIECMEKSEDRPDVSGPVCAKRYAVDYKAVLDCTKSPLGNELQHQMAVKTEKLNPPHTYVPWITLNGVHTEDMEQEADTNLLKLICDNYMGVKPKGCSAEEVVHKCSRY